MKLIGKKQFVIETNLPTGTFKNKQVLNEHTGEIEWHPTEEPEYQWHWFAGVGANPQAAAKGVILWMNVWSPYPEQAVRYKDRDEAIAVNEKMLTSAAGGIVVQWELSHHKEGLQVIVPVPASIMGGISKAGVDSKGRL